MPWMWRETSVLASKAGRSASVFPQSSASSSSIGAVEKKSPRTVTDLMTSPNISKAISMFELAAEQGNTYAEYQLGKLYCFGQGVPQNLEVGMEWLRASASHGNEYAAQLLEKVENRLHQQTVSTVFGLFRGLAGMIQTSANQHIRRRNSIDRKQRQKIEEKKQALGQRSSGQEYDYNEEQTM